VTSLTLQFHPDWPNRGGLVIEAMARDRRYRSQFETQTSNGGLTAYPGGGRWRWESRLFDGRYDALDAEARPVYGAWNRNGDVYGGSPRFGSAYLRLRPHVMDRASFCFLDSVFEPTEVGDATALSHLAALADAAGHDYLDDYVEAHVHGGVRFPGDVEALVLDPCHGSGPVAEAAARLGCAVEHHPGFRVAATGLEVSFRGEAPVALARTLGETLTPALVAAAARSGEHDPQVVKYVWHLLARFGRAG
jgi:hypothetical protein